MAENIEEHVRAAADQTAQLESILDTMSDGVLVLGPHGHIRRCNHALAGEFPAAATAQGAQVVEIIPSPELQKAVDEVLAAPAPSSASQSASHDASRSRSGSEPGDENGRVQRHLHLTLPSGQVMSVCLSRPAGPDSHLGAVAVFHDITELVRLDRVRRDFVSTSRTNWQDPAHVIQEAARKPSSA